MSENDELDENVSIPITEEQKKALEQIKAKLRKKQRQGKTTKGAYTLEVDDKDKVMGFEALKKRLETKFEELGATFDIDSIRNAEDLSIAIGVCKDLEERASRKSKGGERRGGAGTSTWQNEQNAREGSNEGSYESYEAMIRDLKARAILGVPQEKREAQKVLDELLKKGLKGVGKTRSMSIDIPSDEEMKAGIGLKDLLNEPLRQKKLFEKKLKDKRKRELEED